MTAARHFPVLQTVSFAIILAVLCPSAAGRVIYVDDDAAGASDGASWANAYLYLQEALAEAQASPKPVEIRVAQGTYRPDQGANQTLGDREATFRLLDGVTLSGGYAGGGAVDPNARDVEMYETSLSGSLSADPEGNSEHVVTSMDNGGTAVMDGLTITGGYANGALKQGGGMHNTDSSPTLSRCTFTGNSALYGGGMYNADSSPALTDCSFIGNRTTTGGYMGYPLSASGGAGMYNLDSRPTLTNCTFTANTGFSGCGMYNVNSVPTLNDCAFTKNLTIYGYEVGGGMCNVASNPILYDCAFTENSAQRGGAMHNTSSSAMLIDCDFASNSAMVTLESLFSSNVYRGEGGGMYNSSSSPTFINCTFTENAGFGEGGGAMYNRLGSSPILSNCTFSGNSASGSGYGSGNGGGMHNSGESCPVLDQCTFNGNSADYSGGGVFNTYSHPVLTACTFSHSSALEGGAMCNSFSDPSLDHCLFSHNSAVRGGAMYNSDSDPNVDHCLFSHNSATQDGGGMYNPQCAQGFGGCRPGSPRLTHCVFTGNASGRNGGGMFNAGTTTLANCTFAGNRAGNSGGNVYQEAVRGGMWAANSIFWGGIPADVLGSLQAVYSNIQDGWQGEGNIDADPLFADPGYWADANDPALAAEPNDPNSVWVEGDYHLKSQAGRWDPNAAEWVADDVTSPCIDAGDPNSLVDDEPVLNGDRVNMGVYGGTSEASQSPIWLLPPLPGQASMPYPADGTITYGPWLPILSWNAGTYGFSHDVYFGVDDPPPFVRNQNAARYDPGTLGWGATYYWRVDEVNRSGKTTGQVWNFTFTPYKGRSCFTSQTGVWVDGTLTPISQVAPGTRVTLVASAGVGELPMPSRSLGSIEKVQAHEGTFICCDVLFESGNSICVAECHYFLAESGGWVPLQALAPGTRLQTPTGSIRVASVTRRPTPHVGTVYNLVVPGSHRYLVGKDAVIARDY